MHTRGRSVADAAALRWVIVSGEYPPQPGGVSDHTREIARGLAAAGDEVHVIAPWCEHDGPDDAGVRVHRIRGAFGPLGLRRASAELARIARPARILIQYVPQAFGWRGMNLPFCYWACSHRDELDAVFHEVAVPLRWRQSPARSIQSVATTLMARALARAAGRVFMSTTAWTPLLRRYVRAGVPLVWLPVPSSTATAADPSLTAQVRREIAPRVENVVVGHFGVGGRAGARPLREILARILSGNENRIAVLIGRRSRATATAIRGEHPELSAQVLATGGLEPHAVAAHLAASDVLVQPYADGVTTRRTSVMAGLALGKAIVTNDGPSTEAVWRESGAVALAPDYSPAAIASTVEAVLGADGRGAELARRAARLYADQFAVEHTIRRIRFGGA